MENDEMHWGYHCLDCGTHSGLFPASPELMMSVARRARELLRGVERERTSGLWLHLLAYLSGHLGHHIEIESESLDLRHDSHRLAAA